jgi:hypothetical protein
MSQRSIETGATIRCQAERLNKHLGGVPDKQIRRFGAVFAASEMKLLLTTGRSKSWG